MHLPPRRETRGRDRCPWPPNGPLHLHCGDRGTGRAPPAPTAVGDRFPHAAAGDRSSSFAGRVYSAVAAPNAAAGHAFAAVWGLCSAAPTPDLPDSTAWAFAVPSVRRCEKRPCGRTRSPPVTRSPPPCTAVRGKGAAGPRSRPPSPCSRSLSRSGLGEVSRPPRQVPGREPTA